MTEAFALTSVTLVTGDASGTVVPDTTIVVDDSGTINAIGPTDQTEVPAGYRRIDGAGRFAMPGPINAHAHLFSDGRPLPPILLNEKVEAVVARLMHSFAGRRLVTSRTASNVVTQLNSGVTTIRSVGDVRYEVVDVAGRIERGDLLGPRVLASGPLLAIPGGHGAPQIALITTSADDARRNVGINLERGATVIKIAATGGVTDARALGEAGKPEMTEEQMRVVCDEAHRAGVRVAAHAQSKEGIVAALRAGVDTIEHGSAMTPEIIDLYHDNPRSLTGTSAMIPTLQACLPLVKLATSITGINAMARGNAEMVLDEMLAGIADAIANDVTLGMGTDSALTHVTHYNTWRELDHVIRFGGLTPAQALHAATATNAKILGIDTETGALEAGKAADVVVFDENPMINIRTMAQPRLVVARGHVIDAPQVKRFPEIDERLDSF